MYIFYDTETTGLDRDFSQIIQIALVFTDDNLNILASKKMECRKSPWVVPSPGALLTTGFTPDDLKNSPNSNFEMMREINDWARSQHWPVIYAGYNTLGYDEQVLAQNFFQNLMHPDQTTAVNNMNGQENGRFDIMVAVRVAQIYAPDALTLKIDNGYGKPSLSLGNVARQNGVNLTSNDAHDAMNDIKATIGVGKVIMKTLPQLWEQLTKMATVGGVNKFLEKEAVFTYTSVSYGKTQSSVATSIAGDATQMLFDLSTDPALFLSMTQDEVTVAMRKSLDKYAPSGPFLPVVKNSQPILMPLDLSDTVLPPAYDEKLYEARAASIKNDKEFQDKVAKAAAIVAQEQQKNFTNLLPEQKLEKPIAPELQARIDQWLHDFHKAPDWAARRDLVVEFYKRFEEDIKADDSICCFPKFGGRLVFEHAPEVLDDATQEMVKRYIAARVLNPNPKAPYMTIAKARKELQEIEQQRAQGLAKWAEVTDGQIRSLKLYYTSIEKEYAQYVPAADANIIDKDEPKKPTGNSPYKPK